MGLKIYDEDLVDYSFNVGNHVLRNRDENSIKRAGQFLTTPSIARFMARRLGSVQDGWRILDPAIGSGTLICAMIDNLIAIGKPVEIWVDGFEIDHDLCDASREVLSVAEKKAHLSGLKVRWHVYERDFVLECAPTPQPALFPNFGPSESPYDCIIANPPYFKLNRDDPRSRILIGKIASHTNIYTLFMAIAVRMLKPGGCACFIVPRSFCSGQYFSKFRRDFILEAHPISFHVFESRNDLFKEKDVLQENVVLTFEKRKSIIIGVPTDIDELIEISTSKNKSELSNNPISRHVRTKYFLNDRNGLFLFRLPTGVLDEEILDVMDSWNNTLNSLGLDVSTGPVVSFRASRFLCSSQDVFKGVAVPLLWMQNVKPYQVEWPLKDLNKPPGISLSQVTASLLVPKANYVLLRRFSAKEEPRRLIAAPLLADVYHYDMVGLENHLNYIYRKNGHLSVSETMGLTAILNSALVDRYFRIINGNTQVNATELRGLPLPPIDIIRQIGERVSRTELGFAENIVFEILWETGLLPEEFPLLQETRMIMGKIEQAQEILNALGLPAAQRNEISSLTLLVLAQLSENMSWSEANTRSLRVHDILREIKERYHREYAENTRESIRRQVLHQFEQAGIVIRNPDDPALAVNSPRTHYQLTGIALETLRTYESDKWKFAVDNFLTSKGSLLEIYMKTVAQNKVPVRIADGTEYYLSPGKHNELQAQIVHEFGPRFAPGSKLLYLGDAANKVLVFDQDGFQDIGVTVTSHNKLPDVVLYDDNQRWIYLVEAVTTHGPVSPKRQFELEDLLEGCVSARIYVTAFLDFKTFKKFLSDIAWETEVWIAEIPNHLIHFNGEKFLGPHNH